MELGVEITKLIGIENLGDHEVLLPRSGQRFLVTGPVDIDPLLDLVVADPEENMPYWSMLWPSGIALADEIAAKPELVKDKRVLELGCGLGVTATAAVQAGADLVATDYAPEALELCRHNVERNVGRPLNALQINWRKPSKALFDVAGEGFPVVLAADLLYEQRDIEPLLSLVDRIVAPSGLLWLAEPGRPVARQFLEAANEAGWHGEASEHDGPWPDPGDSNVVVAIHLLQR